MSRLGWIVLGVFAGAIGVSQLTGCRNEDLATATRACLHAHGVDRTDCFNEWYGSRGLETPWPTISAADRERVTQLQRAKAPRRVLP